MENSIGDLFWEMGTMFIVVGQERSRGDDQLYWLCDDMSGKSSGTLWFRDSEVTAGKKELVEQMIEVG